MEIKKIEKEMMNTRFPLNEELDFMSLNEEEQSQYLNMYSLYIKMFECFLNSKVGIFDIDKEFSSMNTDFKKIPENRKDFYQSTTNQLGYLYIRNNIYLTRLFSDQINYLIKKLQKNTFEFTEEDSEFIEKTYKRVIYENEFKGVSISKLYFGPETEKFLCSNNSIVLGFRYDNDEELFSDESKEKQEIINKKLVPLTLKMRETFQNESHIITYDDFTIKKKEEFNFSK